MSLFGKLFGGGKKKVSKETVETRGMHMPDLNIPIDEKFTINFKRNGGKFLYCDSYDEVYAALDNIVEENHWENHPFFCLDNRLTQKFSGKGVSFVNEVRKSEVFFTTCEQLIAQNGSILICSHQLMDRKLHELPDNFIVFSTTSQLVESIGEGLKSIKKNYKDSIPGSITTIKHFRLKSQGKEDFLSYGSSAKNLYLILLEDL